MAFLAVAPIALRRAWSGICQGYDRSRLKLRTRPAYALGAGVQLQPRGTQLFHTSISAELSSAEPRAESGQAQPSEAKPSKRALKRAARMLLFQNLRDERLRKTEELLARQKLEREERLAAMHPEQREEFLRAKAEIKEAKRRAKEEERATLRARMESSPQLVMDLELVNFEDARWVRSLRKQIVYLYGANALAEAPFKLHFAGASERAVRECLEPIPGFPDWCVSVSDRPYLETFPHSRITYLSPDADEELGEIAADDVLVVGAVVDRELLKGLTRGKADSQGLRSRRLPLHLSPSPFSTSALPINHASMAAIHFYSTKDWRLSFERALAFGA
eukprot:tig00000663_g2989.t1